MRQRIGSSKIMSPAGEGFIRMRFTDGWSVFDRGTGPDIPGLGKARCACAVRSFGVLHESGIRTHFEDQESDDTIIVQEFGVPGKGSLSGMTRGRVLDTEAIWRRYVLGSLWERVQSGAVDTVTLGLPPGTLITEGMQLPDAVLDFTTKFEDIDRALTVDETMRRTGLTPKQWRKLCELLTQAAAVTNDALSLVGFSGLDGKGELGFCDRDETLWIVDNFCGQDESRIVDEQGRLFCKQILRDHFAALPWKRELDAAKRAHPNDKSRWPEYPPLPDALAALVQERYFELALRYAGVRVNI